jgi:hypothetical protein
LLFIFVGQISKNDNGKQLQHSYPAKDFKRAIFHLELLEAIRCDPFGSSCRVPVFLLYRMLFRNLCNHQRSLQKLNDGGIDGLVPGK